METRYHKLDLDKTENKEFYHLRDKNAILQKQMKFINDKILKMKQPRFFVFCQKYKIKSLYEPIEKMQNLVDDWSNEYTSFMCKPNLSTTNLDPVIGYIHFTRLLEIIDNIIREKQNTIITNFIKVQERNSNQINFVIAIISALLSLAGLLFSIYVFNK